MGSGLRDPVERDDAKALQAWIGYLIGSSGQGLLPGLGYAEVPSNIATMAQAQLSKIGM